MTDVFINKMAQQSNNNCQYSTRYCWEADKVKTLIRLRAELSPLFTGKRNASKYAWAVVERELNVPLPLSKIIKKWNNLLQEYKAIKLSEEPKRREWPFFTLMDVYFSDQVNDPTLRLFSSTKTLKETIDDSVFEDDPIISSAIAAATSGAFMDISEIVRRKQERESEDYDDIKPEVGISEFSKSGGGSNNNNNGNTNSSNEESRKSVISPEQHQRRKEEIQAQQEYRQQQMQQHQHQQQQRQQQQQQIRDHPPRQVHQQQRGEQTAEHHTTIDQYLLSWNNFHGNMCKGFHSLQKDEKMVDVTIAAGGKIFKAHKLVLSVCSPYFQKIFLDHPCSHPILFMTDVDSNHMAGLLDFMYSGQVNVKYEDLPNFLKTAEVMKIKGLHSETTTEMEQDLRVPKSDDPQNRYSNQPPPLSSTPTSSLFPNINGPNNNTSHVSSGSTTPVPSCNPPIPSPNFLSFREHIRSKAAINEAFLNNATNNNNNTIPEKYSIQQTNSSSKILDGRKHHKYFAKRKMLMQYNHDILREKRNRELAEMEQQQQQQQQQEQNSPINDNFKIKLPEIVREEALNLVQTIKKEPEPDGSIRECKREEDCSSTTPTDSTVDEEAENDAKTALLRLRHSILEQNLIDNNNNNNEYSKNNNAKPSVEEGGGNVKNIDRNLGAVCS